MRTKLMAIAAAFLLTACAGPTSTSVSVVVAPYEAWTIPFDSLAAWLAHRPVVATGKVIAANDRAYEVPVDPNAEGNTADDGPEIYGTISFKIESVLKGDVKPGSTLTIVYESGKWSTLDKKSRPRIAYAHEEMAHVQNSDATLKTPAELDGSTFAIFAAPKPATTPVKAEGLYVAGIALVDPAGQVVFTGAKPFRSERGVTLDEIKAAIG